MIVRTLNDVFMSNFLDLAFARTGFGEKTPLTCYSDCYFLNRSQFRCFPPYYETILFCDRCEQIAVVKKIYSMRNVYNIHIICPFWQ